MIQQGFQVLFITICIPVKAALLQLHRIWKRRPPQAQPYTHCISAYEYLPVFPNLCVVSNCVSNGPAPGLLSTHMLTRGVPNQSRLIASLTHCHPSGPPRTLISVARYPRLPLHRSPRHRHGVSDRRQQRYDERGQEWWMRRRRGQ